MRSQIFAEEMAILIEHYASDVELRPRTTERDHEKVSRLQSSLLAAMLRASCMIILTTPRLIIIRFTPLSRALIRDGALLGPEKLANLHAPLVTSRICPVRSSIAFYRLLSPRRLRAGASDLSRVEALDEKYMSRHHVSLGRRGGPAIRSSHELTICLSLRSTSCLTERLPS
jgi:hypothetical protein